MLRPACETQGRSVKQGFSMSESVANSAYSSQQSERGRFATLPHYSECRVPDNIVVRPSSAPPNPIQPRIIHPATLSSKTPTPFKSQKTASRVKHPR